MKNNVSIVSVIVGAILFVPQVAIASDIQIETRGGSVRINNDGSIIINSRPVGVGLAPAAVGSQVYRHLNSDRQNLPSRSRLNCQAVLNRNQQTHQTGSNQVYTRNTTTTQVCQ